MTEQAIKVHIKSITDYYEIALFNDSMFHKDAINLMKKEQLELSKSILKRLDHVDIASKEDLNRMFTLTANAYTSADHSNKKAEAYETYLKSCREQSAKAVMRQLMLDLSFCEGTRPIEIVDESEEADHFIEIKLYNAFNIGDDVVKSLLNSPLAERAQAYLEKQKKELGDGNKQLE